MSHKDNRNKRCPLKKTLPSPFKKHKHTDTFFLEKIAGMSAVPSKKKNHPTNKNSAIPSKKLPSPSKKNTHAPSAIFLESIAGMSAVHSKKKIAILSNKQ